MGYIQANCVSDMGYINNVGDVFRHLAENASWPEGQLVKVREVLDREFPPEPPAKDEKPVMTDAEKAAAYDQSQSEHAPETVSVADQKSGGVPARDTVSVAEQRQGTPVAPSFVAPVPDRPQA